MVIKGGIRLIASLLVWIFNDGSEALEAVKVLGFSSPLWKRGVGGDFIIKTFHCNINELLFCKIPLNPPFPKGEAKSRILSQSL